MRVIKLETNTNKQSYQTDKSCNSNKQIQNKAYSTLIYWMKNGKKIWKYKENRISFKVLNRTGALKILIIQLKKPSKSTILQLDCPLKHAVYVYLGF